MSVVEIPVSPSGVALVDSQFAWLVGKFTWWVGQERGHAYARAHVVPALRHIVPQQKIYMHRLILGLYVFDHHEQVDHINGNTLDNRIENLRVCNGSLNQRNARLRKDKRSSRFKGVFRMNHGFVANITIKGKRTHLGSFKDE